MIRVNSVCQKFVIYLRTMAVTKGNNGDEPRRQISMQELQLHDGKQGDKEFWIAIYDQVYDVTNFMHQVGTFYRPTYLGGFHYNFKSIF